MIKKETIDLFRGKERANVILQNSIEGQAERLEWLHADDRCALLIVFQALEGAGKDRTMVSKFFLHASKQEKKQRFMGRHESPWRRSKLGCSPSSKR